MVEQLQASPNDDALREKIIKLALELKPAPAVPEEARRHFVMAVTLQKDAKTDGDYDLPIQEYRKALRLAPWWSDAYYDLGTALDLKKQYSDAIGNLKLSVMADPQGTGARTAQDKIYAIEAEQVKASSAQERADKERSVAQAQAEQLALLAALWTDSSTGLMWAKEDNGSNVTQAQALEYCRNLSLANFRDWRLPTITELQSIYDPTVTSGQYQLNIKGGIDQPFWVWSSSAGRGSEEAWAFLFYKERQGKSAGALYPQARAQCVRRAGQ